jgi:protein-tyrosine phosphatase
MLWSWSDPVPAVSEFKREFVRLAKADVKRGIAFFLPDNIKRRFAIRRRLGPAAGSIYGRRQIVRTLRVMRDQSRAIPKETRTVLCVCHGNIIRSPMAGALLQKRLGGASGLRVLSAGLFAKAGTAADARAKTAAAGFDISLEGHEAQPVTPSVIESADLILVMDFENEAVLLSRFPDASRKTYLLGGFRGANLRLPLEIPDPYGGNLEDVQSCFNRIDFHVSSLASRLQQEWRKTS